MASNKTRNTFAKRQRETDKRRKAEDKLKRRADRKAASTHQGVTAHLTDANQPPHATY